MTFDEQLRRAVDALAGRLRDEITQHVYRAADDIGALTRADRADADARAYAFGQEAGRLTGLEEGRTAGVQDGEDAIARLVDAMRAIDATRSLTAVLDVLVTQAAREADRAAILLVGDDRLQRWRFIGFEVALDNEASREFPLVETDIAGDAVKRKVVVAADATEPARAPAFAAPATWSESVCVPITLGGDVVAVVYADRRDATAPAQWRPRIELLARHATRSLEALIAFKAARRLTRHAPAAATPQVESEASAEDRTAARRYARLLVSEIRLYHEEAVAAGRRERDLATRLGGEIARARMLYEQRVAPGVRGRADYFQDELVRTLADGDPALLELRS